MNQFIDTVYEWIYHNTFYGDDDSSYDSSDDHNEIETTQTTQQKNERTPLLKESNFLEGLKVSRSTQTSECVSLQMIQEYINTAQEHNQRTHFFKHLSFVNQSYIAHFKDSIYYSTVSLKASFYFLCHALWPDIFVHSGSNAVITLSTTIKNKYFKVFDKM